MESQPIHKQPRKAGVDYTKCQAEFEEQIVLLKEDLKKRLKLAQKEGEGSNDSETLGPCSLPSRFIILIFPNRMLSQAVYRSATKIERRTRSHNIMHDRYGLFL